MESRILDILKHKRFKNFNPIIARGIDAASNKKSDIDVQVNHGCADYACLAFAEIIEEKGWIVINYRRLDYLSSITISKSKAPQENSLKIDFFNGLGWYGIQKKIPKIFLLDEYENNTMQSAITLAHKISYAGFLSNKDIERIGDLDEAIKLLNLDKYGVHKEMINGKIPFLLKWKVRFILSNYDFKSLPLWILLVLVKAARTKLFPIRSRGKHILIYSENSIPYSLANIIKKTYDSSGDANIPRINKQKLVNIYSFILSNYKDPAKKNLLSKFYLKLWQSFSMVILKLINLYIELTGQIFITIIEQRENSLLTPNRFNLIDITGKNPTEFENHVFLKINEIIINNLKQDCLFNSGS